MEQYISKSALVAEIKKRIEEVSQIGKASYEIGLCDAYKIILSFLDTLEVKEVDINKEISKDRYEQLLQYEQERKQRQSMINSFMQNK